MWRKLILPTTPTSSAKKAPASGVPKMEAKPAAMPALEKRSLEKSVDSGIFSPSIRPMATATPSLPTEAPARWLSQVEGIMR